MAKHGSNVYRRILAFGISTILLALAVPRSALADSVTLKSGRSLEGIARIEPGKVIVDTGLGTLTFTDDQVQGIVPGKTAMHDYPDRLAALGQRPTAAQVFDLSMWARDQGLARYVDPLLRRTIEIDPDHREARRLLGYVPFEGQWILRQQREQREEVVAERETKPERETRKQKRTVARPMPEVSRGYVYFGIPPMAPPRGTENHGGYGWAWPIFRGVAVGP